jgi:hypothetical protein
VAERGEVTARHHDRIDAQAITGDALLKIKREEPIISARYHVDRNRRPRVKGAGIVKSLIQLPRGARPYSLDQLRGDVVHEVGGQIELGAVAIAYGCRGP